MLDAVGPRLRAHGPEPASHEFPPVSEALARMVESVAHLLPAQGPIGVFIHHNPLHAFEDMPFEEAVVAACAQLGCEPFLSAVRYRAELLRGRIREVDVAFALREALKGDAEDELAPGVTRFELRRRLCLYGILVARGPALGWILSETPALVRFRPDLPDDAHARLVAGFRDRRSGRVDPELEAIAVRALWLACLDAVERVPPAASIRVPAPSRPRDWVLRSCGVDTDRWIHPLLIRFTSAYLDQGLSHWPLPERERGLYACFVDLYGSRWARQCGAWARTLPDLVAEDRVGARSALESLEHSLRDLGIAPEHWEAFLSETALALRGWAGIVHQLEVRPDRVPVSAVPARLVDFLAVRMLLERAALGHAQHVHGRRDLALSDWCAELEARDASTAPPTREDRAWPLFHLAQLCGMGEADVRRLPDDAIAALTRELVDFGDIPQRRVLHAAYERCLRHRFYDALAHPARVHAAGAPPFQAVFCLDEREESFRRHLEEVVPEVETFGAAGFFGVAMYFQGATDVHPRPLCPVAITPRHYVRESPPIPAEGLNHWQRWREHREQEWVLTRHFGSRTLFRGAALMPILGALSIFPLVLRVLFPALGQRLASLQFPLWSRRPAQLHLEREPVAPPLGEHTGYSAEEMTEIVRTLCENIGATGRLSPLVVVVAHGSTSLNNPHESAHDCGACGGGRGGPNARALARMANHPGVRARLSAAGAPIDAGTWFVGAERNTCDNGVTFFDTDAIPDSHRAPFARATLAFGQAARREAHERCRRFEHASLSMSVQDALVHTRLRASDLAQPRPEYGHATNAVCVVGRRVRTRGLFLDRRAFLVSYDPNRDHDGSVLDRLLGAVVPVVAGISLEYFFGYVDPTGFGCGTKLPHNITGFLGVMDGAQSDLRTGLPWQMLEIHEPVRLTLVVECPTERLERLIAAREELSRLVRHGWIVVAALDPTSGELRELTPDATRRHAPERDVPVIVGTSADCYRGQREHLPVSRIRAEAGPRA